MAGFYRRAILAAVSAAAVVPALAQDAVGFRSPSNNIFCQFFAETRAPADAVIRCDLVQIVVRPPRPRDCDLEWGEAFEISGRANTGAPLCHGDTVRDDTLPVLPYGQTFQRAGLTCISEASGVTCTNARAHGFEISRGRQRVF
jgi:hypothetical protein